MSCLTSDVRIVTERVCTCVDAILHPNTTNAQRYEANEQLNQMLQDIVNSKDNPASHLAVAFELISLTISHDAPDAHLAELYVYYGFKMLESIVKYRWYQLEEETRNQIIDAVRNWCGGRFFNIGADGRRTRPTRISTSKLVLGICSHCVSEIFIRTWPSKWKTFLVDVTIDYSLVTLYSLHDISYYLNTLLVPENANRRKEIIFDLTADHNVIYDYIAKCWKLAQDQPKEPEPLLNDYVRLVLLKSIELMESLLHWFPISEPIILQLLQMATSPSFDNQIRLNLFRCIHVIINRTKVRNEEVRFVEETFFNFGPTCFAHCLLVDILPSTVAMIVTAAGDGDNDEEKHEILTLVFEIATDIVCKAINLYNQISTSKKVLDSFEDNQHVWQRYLESTIKLMALNVTTTNNEDSLQKFLLQYARFDRCNKPRAECCCEQTTRTPIHLTTDIDFRLLELVCRTKMLPVDERTYNEAANNFVSYEHYETTVRLNRSKYIAFVQFLVTNNLAMGKEFILKQLARFLQGQLDYPVQVLANFCSIIIPKLDVDPQVWPSSFGFS